MSRVRHHTVAAALLLCAALAAPAPAQLGLGAGAGREGRDLLLVRTARLQTRGVLTVRLAAEYFESTDASFAFTGGAVGDYTTLRLGARYGVSAWLEACADIPARRAAWEGGDGGATDVTGLDSPVVGFKLAVPSPGDVVSLALSGRACLPIGDDLSVTGSAGEVVHLGGGSGADVEAMLLATADLTRVFPLRLHANVGWLFRTSERTGRRFFPEYYPPSPDSATDNDALILRGAVEFPGRDVDLFTEFRGDLTNGRDLVALKENPLMIMPAARVRFGDGWAATAGVAFGISGDDRDTPDFDPHEAYPDWTATVTVSYAWPVFAADTDGDGIPDFRDECPDAAEDVDGFNDGDGCPDLDNDADGIPDGFDGQPLLMEDYDGFEDDDGVPDLDNDGDGIVDERDMCPDEREDLDGFEDEDGCPDD